jgi:hypothetical protein
MILIYVNCAGLLVWALEVRRDNFGFLDGSRYICTVPTPATLEAKGYYLFFCHRLDYPLNIWLLRLLLYDYIHI